MVEFTLRRFSQESDNIRRYVFQGASSGGIRAEFSVGVDLTLLQRYRIPIQEVPLLCSLLLASSLEKDPRAELTLSEDNMRIRAAERDAELAVMKMKRKPPLAMVAGREPSESFQRFESRSPKHQGIGLASTVPEIPTSL